MWLPGLIRQILKPLFMRTGLLERLEEGKFIPTPSICIPNFLFQRILGVNRSCPWPVHYTSRVMHPQRIRLGRHVAISFAISGGCYIQANNGIIFGDDVIFASGVKIISANHDPSDHNRFVNSPPITIGQACWIGSNAVILPGVSLGDHVIVGAGAVVTKSFPAHAVVAGNPARIIRHLKMETDREDNVLGVTLSAHAAANRS
jgi:acetyltransferase-like isoleucine patch superfamily enzyme